MSITAIEFKTNFSKYLSLAAEEDIYITQYGKVVANKRFSGCITAKSSTDIYDLIHRLTHSDKETRKIFSKLFTLFEVLDSAGIDCRKALSSGLSDYEDAVMVETAVRSDIDCIVTRNKKDYLKSAVFVFSPDEFLNSLCE